MKLFRFLSLFLLCGISGQLIAQANCPETTFTAGTTKTWDFEGAALPPEVQLQAGAAVTNGFGERSSSKVINFPNGNAGMTIDVGTLSSSFTIRFKLLIQEPYNGNWRGIFRQGSSDQERTPGMWLFPSNNHCTAAISTQTNFNEYASSTVALDINKWMDIIFVLGAEQQYYSVYKNGEKIIDHSFANKGPVSYNCGKLRFGKDFLYPGFKGQIDDICIMSRNLHFFEIANLISIPPPPSVSVAAADYGKMELNYAESLFYYTFEDGTTNSFPAGRPGKLVGNASIKAHAIGKYSLDLPDANSAMTIDHVGQYFAAPPMYSMLMPGFTIRFKMQLAENMSANDYFQSVVHLGDGNTKRTPGIYLSPNPNLQKLHFAISTNNDWNVNSLASPVIQAGVWTEVAYVYQENSKTVSLYINKVLAGSFSTEAHGPVSYSNGLLHFGRGPSLGGFVGKIDEIEIYTYALPAAGQYNFISLSWKEIFSLPPDQAGSGRP